jgi:maleamate amidohydrolase
MIDRTIDMKRDYAAAGFGGKMVWGKHPGLILVDFARAYFDLLSPLSANYGEVRANALRLREQAERSGAPIIFTRVEYDGADPALNGGQFYKKVPALRSFDIGNPMGDFTEQLCPAATDIVITKQYPSAFFGTDLAGQLTALGVDTCVVADLSTSGCVRATALDALCNGFVPLVVSDACGDRDRAIHESNLFDLSAKYADVVTTEDALAYLAGSIRENT